MTRTPSKQFSGFSWCLSRENLITTYSNFKGKSVIKFWDLKEDALINELNHRLDEEQSQQVNLQAANADQDREDKSPCSIDNISHDNFEVDGSAAKQVKRMEPENLKKKFEFGLRQNQN